MPMDAGQVAMAMAARGFPCDASVSAQGIVTLHMPASWDDKKKTAAQTFLASLDKSDAGEANRRVARNRSDAATAFLASTALGQALRAEALVLIDEINTLRGWITSFKTAVAAATTLADLKTRVAALANMPDRTPSQAKTAITNKMQDAASDA